MLQRQPLLILGITMSATEEKKNISAVRKTRAAKNTNKTNKTGPKRRKAEEQEDESKKKVTRGDGKAANSQNKANKKKASKKVTEKKGEKEEGSNTPLGDDTKFAALSCLNENPDGATKQTVRKFVGEKRVGLEWLVNKNKATKEVEEGKVAPVFKITRGGKTLLNKLRKARA